MAASVHNKLSVLFVALLSVGVVQTAAAQDFRINSMTLDATTGAELGGMTEQGNLNAFFAAQKSLLFRVLDKVGISPASLPQAVLDKLNAPKTSSFAALVAFSEGLDQMDKGNFTEAKASFDQAARIDPKFSLAVELRAAMPTVNATTPQQVQAVIQTLSQAASDQGKQLAAVVLAAQTSPEISAANIQTVLPAVTPTTTTANTTVDSTTTAAVKPTSGQLPFTPLAPVPAVAQPDGGLFVGFATDAFTLSGNVVNFVKWVSPSYPGSYETYRIGTASVVNTGQYTLPGTTSVVYWGAWSSPDAQHTASIESASSPGYPPQTYSAFPNYSYLPYMIGDLPSAMPSSGTAVYSLVGSFGENLLGSISVNYGSRQVAMSDVSFYNPGNGVTIYHMSGSGTYSAPTTAADGHLLVAGNSWSFSGGVCLGGVCGSTPLILNGYSASSLFFGPNAEGFGFSGQVSTQANVSGTPVYSSKGGLLFANVAPPAIGGVMMFKATDGSGMFADGNAFQGDTVTIQNNVVTAFKGPDFSGNIGNATVDRTGSYTFAGTSSTVYWGRWAVDGATTASVILNAASNGRSVGTAYLGSGNSGGTCLSGSTCLSDPTYMYGDLPTAIPVSGTATYSAAAISGGSSNVSGSIAVNFGLQTATLTGLGFTTGGGEVVSGVATSAMSFDPQRTVSGGIWQKFGGGVSTNVISGSCSGGACVSPTTILPGSSTFGGAFVGTQAQGIIAAGDLHFNGVVNPIKAGPILFVK